VDDGSEGLFQLFASGGEGAHLLHPPEAPLDGVPLAIGRLIERGRSAPLASSPPKLVLSVRDHGADASPSQVRADSPRAVALVAGEALGARPSSDPNGLHERFQEETLVPLAWAQDRGERRAQRVREQMDLRAEAASAVAEGLVAAPFFAPPAARFARMFVPSASHVW
jgi:hypothetical protein